ncbi:MAG: molybdopterin-dependent oxidoreductase [Chloroflexi bacterium]|nr:molybdopterin-dependent oxidoreductase [Chloroflexota bacterium]
MAKFTRRDFLKIGGSAAAAGAAATVINRTRGGTALAHPPSEFHFVAGGEETFVPTVCTLCPSGCGIVARVVDGRAVKLEGNPVHPINLGALCPKGQASLELLYNPDRIKGPMRRVGERGQGGWEPINWETALQMVTDKLQSLRANGKPERFAFLYGETRGQMRPLIERFTQAIGSPNAISHDSLNIEASKLAYRMTQGINDLLAYDLENTNYILSFGASLLEAGRFPQRMIAGLSYTRRSRPVRSKFVMIDPRQGVTGAKADEWIPIKPGTDAALAMGIAYVLISSNMYNKEFVENYTFGFEDFEDEQGNKHQGFRNYVLRNFDLKKASEITGIPSGTIARIAGEFATNPPAFAIVPHKGGLLNGSANGLYTAMAVHALNALLGNIDKHGGMLVQRYPACPGWPAMASDRLAEKGRQAERVDGAGTRFPLAQHAYQAVAERVLAGEPYPVETLFLYDANPVYECPGGANFIEAFQKIPFIVSFASFLDETAQYADLILPDHVFLERLQDDFVEGLGYTGVALRQPVVKPLYRTRNAADVLIDIAHRVGGPVAASFPWGDFEELLKYRLQDVGTDWDGLKKLGVWSVPPYEFTDWGAKGWTDVVGRDRQRAPRDGRFDFYSREMFCYLGDADESRLKELGISVTGDAVFMPHYEPVTLDGEEKEYPYHLNVITLMSIGPHSYNANLPTLQEISGMAALTTWDSWVEINPETAQELGIHHDDQVWVESAQGRVRTRARIMPGLRPDVINLPYNQGHTAIGHWAKDRGVHGLDLMKSHTEPLTGLATFTNTRVKIYRA